VATAPWFVVSPNGVLSLVGLLHGPDKTVPTPAEDWRLATVEVVIPAFREEDNIVHCLASLARQTLKPKYVILIDDGGGDLTCERAREFAASVDMQLTVIQRRVPIGKTPTIKRQAREFDADVEFILDADTFLENENYIERCVQELYQGIGIASACGTILPMRLADRNRLAASEPFQKYLAGRPWSDPFVQHMKPIHHLWWAITNIYRDCLYRYLQRFVYHGQMVFFGSITNPVGCAVAYRRKYIKDLFDHYEPIFGDDLTNSEDIFIGFALNNEGYRNIQLMDVIARSEEPEVQKLPRQLYLWSSSFLQSCYYFDALVKSPFKAPKRAWRALKNRLSGTQAKIEEARRIKEQYRQPFGRAYTEKMGRPIGWVILLSLLEKISFPAAIIIMIALRWWEPLAVTLLAETAMAMLVLAIVSPGERLKSIGKTLLTTPLRYLLLLWDAVTIARFTSDLWITRNRKWRK
jgi:glycosyltransferase involved in cell wall biosynthesis